MTIANAGAFIAAATAAALSASPAAGQGWIVYDAGLGTMPQAQNWQERQDINPPASPPRGVIGDELHLDTTALGNNVPENNGGGLWWTHNDVNFSFSEPFVVETRVRIASAPDRSVNHPLGWPRPGYALAVYDRDGRIFWIGFGSGEIFLSNTAFGQYNSPNTLTLAIDTSVPHVYRLQRAAGGVGATLLIDGVERLTLAALGPVEGSPQVYFGDPTYWANSESFTSWVRFSGAACGADFNGDGFVDFFDLDAFIAAFEAGLISADYSGDGFIDFFDLDAYIAAFEAGC